MNSVFCILTFALFCGALAGAAQRNGLGCGGDFGTGTHCAVTLDNGKDVDVKEARRAHQKVSYEMNSLTRQIIDLSEKCGAAGRYTRDSSDAVDLTKWYIEQIEKFMDQYPRLDLNQYIPPIEEVVKEIQETEKVVQGREKDICDAYAQASEQHKKIGQAFKVFEDEWEALGEAPSQEALKSVIQNSETVLRDIASARTETDAIQKEVNRKVFTAEQASIAAKERGKEAQSTLDQARREYDEYDREYHEKIATEDFNGRLERQAREAEDQRKRAEERKAKQNPSDVPTDDSEESKKTDEKPEENTKPTRAPRPDQEDRDNSTHRGAQMSVLLVLLVAAALLC